MRARIALFLLTAACGRTALEVPTLVATITPPEQTVTTGASASWLGSANESDGRLIFGWRILARPASASAALSSFRDGAQLRPDRPGDWVIELQLADDTRTSEPVRALLHVQPSDAGVPDAGVRDAGIDAGVRDAGVDAGLEPPLFPTEIYLAGTLSEGACYLDAFANILTPDVASVGFECGSFPSSTAVIRPSDGRLVYMWRAEFTDANAVREYRCDLCRITSYPMQYPMDPTANDPVVVTPCPAGERVGDFLVSVEGEVLHVCSGNTWRDSTGAVVLTLPMNERLMALGADGWGITDKRLLNWKTSVAVPIVGIPPVPVPDILARRWSPLGGFNVAMVPSFGGGGETLWRVSLAGTAQLIGTYSPLPLETNRRYGAVLDREGRLFHPGSDLSRTFTDIIVRREIGAPSTIVYTEASDPLVKSHASTLVTGP